MAKGPRVTPEVELLVARVHRQHPKWKAPRVRDEVESRLRDRNPNISKGWPSLSKVQKILAVVRKTEHDVFEEDAPWHIGTLCKFPIAPEALPDLVKLWSARCRSGKGLTIRQAVWFGRLYGIAKAYPTRYVHNLIFDFAEFEQELEDLGYLPHIIEAFHPPLNMLLAQEVTGERFDDQAISNIVDFYKIDADGARTLRSGKLGYEEGVEN